MRLLDKLSGLIPVLLLGGLGLMIFSALCAITGEAPLRHKPWAYRDKEPKLFWRLVLIYFVVGLVLLSIGFCLYLRLDATTA